MFTIQLFLSLAPKFTLLCILTEALIYLIVLLVSERCFVTQRVCNCLLTNWAERAEKHNLLSLLNYSIFKDFIFTFRDLLEAVVISSVKKVSEFKSGQVNINHLFVTLATWFKSIFDYISNIQLIDTKIWNAIPSSVEITLRDKNFLWYNEDFLRKLYGIFFARMSDLSGELMRSIYARYIYSNVIQINDCKDSLWTLNVYFSILISRFKKSEKYSLNSLSSYKSFI